VILRAPFSKSKSHEDLFVAHYDFLTRRALQITQGGHEEAEDLVQDLYVQWVRVRPELDFDDDERVRGYLYVMMRNLSVSRARRAGSDALSSLGILDYESAEFAFVSADRSKVVQVRSALARTCEYTRVRMLTSRAASVLALRFFFGYYPSEIASILQTTPVAIAKLLQAARLEARVYLEKPATLRFLGQEIKVPSLSTALLPDDPIALFAELRGRILSVVIGECFPPADIDARYASRTSDAEIHVIEKEGAAIESQPFSTAELAHVASCSACLDAISHALGIEGLSERCSSDSFDRKDGGIPPASPGDHFDLDAVAKKTRQTYEHVPAKLQLSVDGDIRVAQLIGARNELQVKLDPLNRPSFLEVISEQGVRLAYLQIEDQQLVEQEACVSTSDLSNGRSVELRLSFESGALIATALYFDPLLLTQFELSEHPPAVELAGALTNPYPSHHATGNVFVSWASSFFPSFESAWSLALASALACVAVLGIALWMRSPAKPSIPTATMLIAQARRAEDAKMVGGAAIHSRFALETRSSSGKVIATQTVDRWSSAQPRRSALRLLDEKGRLVAGIWQNDKGGVSKYPKKDRDVIGDRVATSMPQIEEPWVIVGEGIDTPTLSTLQPMLNVTKENNGYGLHLANAAEHSAGGLTKADWIIDSASSEPVRGNLWVQSQGETREYRFRRLTYEVVPSSAILEQDFDEDIAVRDLRAPMIPVGLGFSSAHLILVVLAHLNQLDPQVREALDVRRQADGDVEIAGVLESQEVVAEIKRSASALPDSRHITFDLHWTGEPPTASQSPTAVSVMSVPVNVEHVKIPFDSALRSSLADTGLTGDALEAGIVKAAQDSILHGTRAQRAAYQLHQLAEEDVYASDLTKLSDEDREVWLRLMNSQAQIVLQELAEVRRALILTDSLHREQFPGAEPPGSGPLDSPPKLAVATKQLDAECGGLSAFLTKNLTLSPTERAQPPNREELAYMLAHAERSTSRISNTLALLTRRT